MILKRVVIIGVMGICSTPLMAEETKREDDLLILDPVIVTASARYEDLKSATSTVQVIDQAQIARSSASDLTSLLAENAVGFFSEWTPGQTSINIRGASTDGQGKDFKSQVLVLINGRRAGTANLSKLSPSDVYRIEIVRGPASVIYGSQAIGGVINIIMKNGHNTKGGKVTLKGGSFGLAYGHGEYGWQSEDGQFTGYFGFNSATQNDYDAGQGGGKQHNTSWKRHGFTGAFSWQLDETNLVDLSVRKDGVYDVGFRGSAANYHAKEDRYNKSADLIWKHGTDSDRLRWKLHNYWFEDVDDFKWASPSTAGTSLDHNKRKLSAVGLKFQPEVDLTSSNTLLLGADLEKNKLRSTRYRVGLNGAPMTQVSPYDNNQREKMYALYFEDAQRFLDDRLVFKAGARYTDGKTYYDRTPYLQNQQTGSTHYYKTTWSTGLNFQATDWLNLKASMGTGFRAPTASELGADYTTLAGSQIYGTPGLKPETNKQYELGAVFSGDSWLVDVVYFENKIKDRIITKPRSNTSNISDYVNNPDDVVVRGIEVNSRFMMHELLSWQNNWQWNVEANGAWNFHMEDKGAKDRNTDKVQRMYQYQASIANRFGQREVAYPWFIQVTGILRGPMWYDTEERLIAGAEPYRNYIHRKSPFMVWNIKGEVEVYKNLTVFAEVNNLFDKNQHPIFIAIDKKPYILDPAASNGGLGTSMMGRAVYVGSTYRF
ncbi:TonB-dependent receptor [Entomomonas sp. E2T0]|uniref:TonB-dependent receptor n=1 Tax=Entomomonas sp. E2T0 TaxID=2930213 RepID=UPI0022285281|nr:TonB-dependent receptor [Entomomonas sp. E2T0]UYZ83396.1 TonB-dependent receptor [Entomomonas sp. E2T0]